jgi:hypothetical protein
VFCVNNVQKYNFLSFPLYLNIFYEMCSVYIFFNKCYPLKKKLLWEFVINWHLKIVIGKNPVSLLILKGTIFISEYVLSMSIALLTLVS